MDPTQPTPLMIACNFGHLKDVKKLLSDGCDINESPEGCDGITPLHLSSGLGRRDIMELLISKGCNLEQPVTKVPLLYIFRVKTINAVLLNYLYLKVAI